MNKKKAEKVELDKRAEMAEMLLNKSLLDRQNFDAFFDWLKRATIKDIEDVIVENKTHIIAKNLRIIKLYAQWKVQIEECKKNFVLYIVKVFVGSAMFIGILKLTGPVLASFFGSLNKSFTIKGTLNGLQPHPTYVPHDQPISFHVNGLYTFAIVTIFILIIAFIFIKESKMCDRLIAFKHVKLKYDYLIEILK
ncbi:hypothetical protein [Lacticaseibacillus paracasei]